MDSEKITLEIIEKVEKTLDLGYTRLYVNVDNLGNGYGFLRVLAMQGPKDAIVYEAHFYWMFAAKCWNCLKDPNMR